MCKETRKVIVYVEDEPDMVDLLRLIFDARQFAIEAASKGRQGLELIRQCQPDLVLLDLMLPDIDGWQVFQAMQKDPALKDIPVVILTVRTEGKIEGFWSQTENVAGYVTKPFSLRQLRKAVEQALVR